ncbi:hypothetical protein [Aquiluna sp. KACHI24]|uniref:hypothetical protein n=1 Tax=Aquiluna sp. KACHI24 TaxID=2968831 RepID=UPI0022067458|nr:hypothetical protein [Aquiluna sp. KACHI24]BDQ00971.1 hypothetical protein AKACHI_13070 [Aquiluna sp. KACHI24]
MRNKAIAATSALIATMVLALPVSATPLGSGAPFTQVLPGQLSVEQCPVGYQGANGLIVDVSTRQQYTECWPANAWEAYRIGGSTWERFKESGGTYDVAADRRAWEAYYAQIEAAKQAAYEESLAWNQANPGRQKCVSWGPFTDPNGGQSSGGVCANPVSAPVAPSGSPSIPAEPVSAGSVGETDIASSSASVSASAPVSNSPAPSLPVDPVPSGGSSYRGSGFPFTVVVEGQVGVEGCPSGFQAANGLIADVGTRKVYTECWPERAWTAYRLGGETWDLYRSTGGTYDPSVEIDRRAKVALLKSRAREIAEAAAKLTPGIERCSSWSGFGESGRECAYAFIQPGSASPVVTPASSSSPTVSPIIQAPASTSSDLGQAAAPTNSDSSTSNSVSVELQAVQVSGSAFAVARQALLITPDPEEAASISSLASAISSLRTIQRTVVQTLPRDPSLNYRVTSLTPEICKASSFRVRVNTAGVCQLEIEITDSAGNSYEILRKVRRTK